MTHTITNKLDSLVKANGATKANKANKAGKVTITLPKGYAARLLK